MSWEEAVLDRLGPWFVWILFLTAVWFWARPVLILIAAALMVAAVVLGVTKKLEEQGKEISKSWRKGDTRKDNKNV